MGILDYTNPFLNLNKPYIFKTNCLFIIKNYFLMLRLFKKRFLVDVKAKYLFNGDQNVGRAETQCRRQLEI